jgi:5-(carboxyamino)imidazole ribonucleotide synthase
VSARPILPGATLGVLGSGQLGRMFAMAARRMGYRVHVLSPDSDTPTGQVADVEITAEYADLDAIRRFARGVDVVTFEFENVPAATAQAAADFAPVRPAGSVLHVAQQRAREKRYLAEHGFPVTPFAWIRTDDDLEKAVAGPGVPGVLKTASFGYDGKGQAKVATAGELTSAWAAMGRPEAVLERYIHFEREVSVVAARGVDGWAVSYGVIENVHANHILDVSVLPADVSPDVERRAAEIARGVLESLDVVGVLCVEFFLTADGELLINELAPRPHNSGHLTIDGCMTSQFEQQVRAICGLPPGSTELLRPAAMANLLGDLWLEGEPNWAAACALPGVHLHLYGKTTPKPGRKMGHLTALADSRDDARALVLEARSRVIARRAPA